ncbi:hypothetical protein [Halalkaliarchaeum desulfuricum]|uniref:hypothetical protein n=1 Tax=Halalkaliarchaeum desulfuricum TaxID=2055893 RepID=UPI001FE7A8E6|nr:hypothetical protein [Halalkaliarchaeum desulfuricum]
MTRRWAIALVVFGFVVAVGFVWGHYTGRIQDVWIAGVAAGLVVMGAGVKYYRKRSKAIQQAGELE